MQNSFNIKENKIKKFFKENKEFCILWLVTFIVSAVILIFFIKYI